MSRMRQHMGVAAAVAWWWAFTIVGADSAGGSEEVPRPMESLPYSGRSVLRVSYEGPNVAHLTLDQGRGEVDPEVDSLSFEDRRRCCADLCRAGLGGPSCGKYCEHLVPVDLLDRVHNGSATGNSTKNETALAGRPRFGVCPALCDNNLGRPICGCNSKRSSVNWMQICAVFCENDYRLSGCPSCKDKAIKMAADPSGRSSEQFATMQDIWIEWCQYQCSKGDGGAACNCDMAPLMLII